LARFCGAIAIGLTFDRIRKHVRERCHGDAHGNRTRRADRRGNLSVPPPRPRGRHPVRVLRAP